MKIVANGRLLLITAFTLLLLLVATIPSVRADDGGLFEIDDAADLTWGFKRSWRIYVPAPDVSDGASILPSGSSDPYNLAWTFDSGTYNPLTQTTILKYKGTAHWQKYKASDLGSKPPPGYEGPHDPYILDVTMSNPVVTISRDESFVRADFTSRNRTTWQFESFSGARVVSLDVSTTTPTVDAGSTVWADIPASTGPAAPEVFAGGYREGINVDPVSVTYTGPGGAPDFSESWDEPNTQRLEASRNVILHENGVNQAFEAWLYEPARHIVHYKFHNGLVGANRTWTFFAFSLETMDLVGQPLVLPNAERPTSLMFFDPDNEKLFYESSGQTQWIRFNLISGEYEQGTLSQPIPYIGPRAMYWDSVGHRAVNIARTIPVGVGSTDFDNHVWKVNTYTENDQGLWNIESYELPNFPTGLNRTGYGASLDPSHPALIAAQDGSLIVLGVPYNSSDPNVSAPDTYPGAYRIHINDGIGATIEPIEGTEVTKPTPAYSGIYEGPNGQITLAATSAGSGPRVQNLFISGDGSTVDVQSPVLAAGLDTQSASDIAVDSLDGTVWLGGQASQRLQAVKDGRVVADQLFNVRHPRGGILVTGPDHTIYAQTGDGLPAGVGGSPKFGMGEFRRVGVSPAIVNQPASKKVALIEGDDVGDAIFTSTAIGEPKPITQWQVKSPGASRFIDITGESEDILTINAERGMDGTEYRAVYENAAGRIASDPARLQVHYAPQLTIDAGNVSITEGSRAELSILPDANPEPEIAWQRRNAEGLWVPIALDDDNFTGANGPNLTVLDTNTAQSGMLFRAKVSNSVGMTFSHAAKLTVTPKVAIPPGGLDLENVSFEWTGNAEMQKNSPAGTPNYFSAGASQGTEATYRSVAGNAAVYQRSPSGGESLATWSTRGAHVSGGGRRQIVRLYGGDARVEPDGAATVRWNGSFSVNFYGGLVPFTFTDPELTVDADGSGALKAEMSGCASNIDNPSVCTPFASVPDVTVADFSGVEIDPSGEVEVKPEYAGVEVDEVDPTKPQVRTGSGWGSWPASFVSFHVQTGLAAYWYSSGGDDTAKPPFPFAVDFQGDAPPSAPPPEEKPADAAQGSPATPAAKGTVPTGKPLSVAPFKRTQRLGGRRVARLATLSCPALSCKVRAPKRVRAKIGKRRYPFVVLAPKRIGAGTRAALRLKLSKRTLKALGKRRRATTVKLRVRSGGQLYLVRAMLRGAGKGKAKIVHVSVQRLGKGGSGPLHDISSAPLSGEPPLLRRPPTAVDVTGVRLAWYPRDSWLRYASSGVGSGDGIHTGNGATGIDSTSSACPDRETESDAQLPYTIEFTPRQSWYDPASGIAGVYGQGSVGFRWKARTIDLTASDPEIEINGAASRAIFRFSGSEGTSYPNQRTDLLTLDTAGKPTVSDGGKTLTYDLMRGTLTPNGVNVFAGFYTPPTNDEFGCVSVSFAIP